MISGCCGPSSLPGIAVRSGSSESARLTLAEGLRFLKVPSSPTSSSGRCSAPRSERSVVWGWAPETTVPASMLVPSARVTPVARPPLTSMAATSAFGADLRSCGPRRGGYGLGDAPHAAAHEAPAAGHAVDLAHPVVQEHVGGAGAHRAAPHADDAPGGERALYPLVHEVAVEEVRAAHRHQVHEPRDAPPVPEGVAPERERLDHVGEGTDARVGGPLVEQGPDEVGELAELAVVLQVRLAIPGVDLPDLLGRPRRVVPEQEARAVREGGEIGRVERIDVVAVLREIQLPSRRRRDIRLTT